MIAIVAWLALGVAGLALGTAWQARALTRRMQRRVHTICGRLDATLDAAAAEHANADRVRDQGRDARATTVWSAPPGSVRGGGN
jgi:hypothetical protein